MKKERLDHLLPEGYRIVLMKKIPAFFLILFLLAIVSFSTWQLFLGNLEAAFSTVPFLVILYFFVVSRQK